MRRGSLLSLFTLVSRVLGLLREMTKAALLGTSPLSDAFSVAFLIPNLLRRLFAEGSIAVAFIPTFKEYLLEGDRAKIRDFLSCIFTFLCFFVSLAVALGILAAPWIVRLFKITNYDETLLLTRIMFPFLAFISLAALFQGILNTVYIFTPPALAPILLNLVTIFCSYALSPFMANPARAMAAGIFIGGFLEAAVQFPFVLKQGFRFAVTGLKRAITNPGTRKVLRLIGPTIVGMAAYQLNDLVSTILATRSGDGVVSGLQYSLRLQELFLGIFAVSLGTVLLPGLTEDAKTGQWALYNERLISAMDIIALLTVPFTFLFLIQGENLIRLLFQTRNFGETSVALTLRAFRFHIPGLFFIALNRILAPAFYAQGDSTSPTIAGILSFAVNIGLALFLAGPFAGSGIALALTAASVVNAALLLVFLSKNPNIAVGRALSSALLYAAKLVLCSCAAGLPVYLLSPRLNAAFAGRGRFVSFGLPFLAASLIFAAIGILLLAITRDKQALAIAGMFGKKKQKT
ncbi:MAG: murein biosynthesis integral membrane protein MurJ [Spirochaetaceae bacterium]|nr:murein biosynthesis integral membrane protein MurJ [Spirochaetaceae bacterium]